MSSDRLQGLLVAAALCLVESCAGLDSRVDTVVVTDRSDAPGPRILCIVAHPDDEIAFAGTMYKTVKMLDGSADILTITNGEGGFKYSTPAEDLYAAELTEETVGRAELPGIRRRELIEGCGYLLVHRIFFLQQKDHRYTQDVGEVLGDEAEVWDLEFVRTMIRQQLAAGDYDFVFTLIAHPTTHGHHQAATLLALEAVSEMPAAERPVILGARTARKDDPARGVIGLPGRPQTRVSNQDRPLLFDRTETFGYRDRLDYRIVVHWAIAAHKSQGTMQVLMGQGEVEQFFLYSFNDEGAEEQARTFFESLKGSPFPAKTYGPSAGT